MRTAPLLLFLLASKFTPEIRNKTKSMAEVILGPAAAVFVGRARTVRFGASRGTGEYTAFLLSVVISIADEARTVRIGAPRDTGGHTSTELALCRSSVCGPRHMRFFARLTARLPVVTTASTGWGCTISGGVSWLRSAEAASSLGGWRDGVGLKGCFADSGRAGPRVGVLVLAAGGAVATHVGALTADLHVFADDVASGGPERVSRAVDVLADETREGRYWPARVTSDAQDESDRPCVAVV